MSSSEEFREDSRASSFVELLAERARLDSEGIAYIDASSVVTWSHLEQLVHDVEDQLRSLGVVSDEVVAVRMWNCVEFVTARLALDRLGCASLALSPSLGPQEMQSAMDQTGATTIVLGPLDETDHESSLVQQFASVATLEKVITMARLADKTELSPLVASAAVLHRTQAPMGRTRERNVSLYMVTSGTTGRPKAFGRSDAAFIFRAGVVVSALHITRQDIVYSPAPITQGIGSLFGFACGLMSGAATLLTPKFSPTAAVQAMERWQATVLGGVPTHAYRIRTLADQMHSHLDSLRVVALGGAHASPQAQRDLETRFGCLVLNYYGMGELGIPAIPTVCDDEAMRHRGIGRIVPGVEVAILDDAGEVLPNNATGEICVRGAGVGLGYADEKSSARLFDQDGWGHSGDLGFIDDANRLHMVGRKKDLIIRGGLNISPLEIEEELLDHPQIDQCVSFGVPDDDLGEVVAVALVPATRDAEIGEDELRAWLTSRGLSEQKVPTVIVSYERIPTTEVGKVDRLALIDEASRQLEKRRQR